MIVFIECKLFLPKKAWCISEKGWCTPVICTLSVHPNTCLYIYIHSLIREVKIDQILYNLKVPSPGFPHYSIFTFDVGSERNISIGSKSILTYSPTMFYSLEGSTAARGYLIGSRFFQTAFSNHLCLQRTSWILQKLVLIGILLPYNKLQKELVMQKGN